MSDTFDDRINESGPAIRKANAVLYGCMGSSECACPAACIRLAGCAVRRGIAVASCRADFSDYAARYADTGCADCIIRDGKIANPGCADAVT